MGCMDIEPSQATPRRSIKAQMPYTVSIKPGHEPPKFVRIYAAEILLLRVQFGGDILESRLKKLASATAA